jgi:carbon-monoxide dehydrogenase large subunit
LLREQLSANANCREHDYLITAFADAEGRLLGIDCEANVDAGLLGLSNFGSPGSGDDPKPVAGTVRFQSQSLPRYGRCDQQVQGGRCLAIELVMDAIARQAGIEPYQVRLRNLVRPDQMPFDKIASKHFDSSDYPQCMRRAVAAIDLESVRRRQKRGEPDGVLIGVGLRLFASKAPMVRAWCRPGGRRVVPGYEPAVARLTTDGD